MKKNPIFFPSTALRTRPCVYRTTSMSTKRKRRTTLIHIYIIETRIPSRRARVVRFVERDLYRMVGCYPVGDDLIGSGLRVRCYGGCLQIVLIKPKRVCLHVV